MSNAEWYNTVNRLQSAQLNTQHSGRCLVRKNGISRRTTSSICSMPIVIQLNRLSQSKQIILRIETTKSSSHKPIGNGTHSVLTIAHNQSCVVCSDTQMFFDTLCAVCLCVVVFFPINWSATATSVLVTTDSGLNRAPFQYVSGYECS